MTCGAELICLDAIGHGAKARCPRWWWHRRGQDLGAKLGAVDDDAELQFTIFMSQVSWLGRAHHWPNVRTPPPALNFLFCILIDLGAFHTSKIVPRNTQWLQSGSGGQGASLLPDGLGCTFLFYNKQYYSFIISIMYIIVPLFDHTLYIQFVFIWFQLGKCPCVATGTNDDALIILI